ncbi:MAG: copper resistance CopC family protein, partial [Actinomycetota bacterium]
MAAVLVVAGVVLGMAGPVGAHAVLRSSSPAAGAQLPSGSPPAAVELRFTEAVRIEPDAIRVVRADGVAVEVGPADRDGGGEVVRAALPRIADGAYLVAWRAVSADGHPVQGAFVFAVGTASPDEAAGRADEALAGTASSTTVGFLFGLV